VSVLTDILGPMQPTAEGALPPLARGITAAVSAFAAPRGWRYTVAIDDVCTLSNLSLERAVGFLVRTGGFSFHDAITALEQSEAQSRDAAPVVITAA
jgi:hypothetical protein